MGHCKKCYKPKYLCCCLPCPKPCRPQYDRYRCEEPPHVGGTWKLSLKTWRNSTEPVDCSQIVDQTSEDPLILEITQCYKDKAVFASALVKRGPLSGEQFVGVFKKTGNDQLPFWELVFVGNTRPLTLTINFVGDEQCPHRLNFITTEVSSVDQPLGRVGVGRGKRITRPH